MALQLGLNPTLTFSGNTTTEKLIGSIAEARILRVLQNELSTQFLFRASATATNINEIVGVATAIYRQTKRNVWSTKYDLNTGAEIQRGGGMWTPVQINKMLNLNFVIEDYDIEKFEKGDTKARAAMIADWVATFTINLMQNLELIFRRGVQDYYIARYAIDQTSIMVFDPSSIKTEDDAKSFFENFGLKMVEKIRTINETMIGTNTNDWYAVLDMSFIKKLTKAFIGFIDKVGAETLTSGRLYKDSVFGTPVSEDFWLDREYKKDSVQKMNIDIDFNLLGTIGMIVHNENFAQPINFKFIKQTLHPQTLNIQWIGKCLVALPVALRPDLGFLIRKKAPTEDEMKAALAKGCSTNNATASPMDDLNTHSYQISIYDALHAKLTEPETPDPDPEGTQTRLKEQDKAILKLTKELEKYKKNSENELNEE